MTSEQEMSPGLTDLSDFHVLIGIRSITATAGTSEVVLETLNQAANSKGDLHGGALAALLDVAMSRAVRSANPDHWGVSTVSLTLSYLDTSARRVVCKGKVTRNGGKLAFAEGQVRDSEGRVVVTGTAIFRKIKSPRLRSSPE